MNLNDLHTFVLVAEAGTFAGAAARLGVPKSTVSRRVARLEAELGLPLLTRSARSFVLSDDGRALYDRCAPALRDIGDVQRDLGDSDAAPRGTLRVSASIDFGTTDWFASLVADYGDRYPEVQVRLAITNRVVDLLEEGIDLALRTHLDPLPDRDDLVARRLGSLTIGMFANPAYLERAGRPDSLAALADHRVVSHGRAYLGEGPQSPNLVADDYRPVAGLLAAGAGVGVLPDFVASPHLRRGSLVRVLPEWRVKPATVSLVWLRSRHLAPRVRAFINVAVEHAAGAEGWVEPSADPPR
ncbi:MAG: LysR family transcriptional regulator [Myxococcota bacterium]